MSQYEITFLLNEEEVTKKIQEFIESFSGKIADQKSWGKKMLAYPIKKLTSAYFYNWSFEMDKNNLQKLKRSLDYEDKLIRYLLLITSD
jgi:ribosomal protein S6